MGSSLKTWLTLSFLVLLCLLLQLVLADQFHVPTARIVLVNLDTPHNTLRTITQKTNHEIVLTVPTGHREAYMFECNASYPVEWNYFGEGAPETNADVARHFTDFYNVNTYTYQAVLLMNELDELQSGRYVCRGSHSEQEKLQIHYDLFVPGNGTQMLISTAEKKVFVPETKLLVSLPCEVTDPSLTVNLYKGNDWGAFHRVNTNDTVVFRPRKGFILKMHELLDPFGTYMCITPDNKRRRKIHLIPEQFRDRYDETRISQKIPVHMSYDYEHNRMLCCNNGGISSIAPKVQWASCGSVQDCRIKSVCFEEDRCGGGVGKQWMDPGPLPNGCSAWKLKDDAAGDFGIIKCSTPGVNQYQPYLLNRGSIFVDFDTAPPSETILTLTKFHSDPIYLGNEAEYHCNSTRFYFAVGIRWAFKRGNDDIEFIEDSSKYIVKDQYQIMSHSRKTKFRIMHPDIRAIICFVPIANSPTEWRTVSLPISIRDTFDISKYTYHGVTTSRPGGTDYSINRIPFASASQLQPVVVEPHSTSKPHLFMKPSPLEPDHVPRIDIDEIISLGAKGRLPVHTNYQHQQQPIQSTHRQKLHRQELPAAVPSYRPLLTPEVTTLDNARRYQQQQNGEGVHFPSQNEIEEANMMHRFRHQMHKENIVPYTTTPRSAFVPPLFRRPTTIHHHKEEFMIPPESYYKPFENVEYKVSSKIEIGPNQVSNAPRIRYHTHSTAMPFPLVMEEEGHSSTHKPVYYKHGYVTDDESEENVDLPIPTRISNPRQPIIHYDSREKQYGLRDPTIAHGTPKGWNGDMEQERFPQSRTDESPVDHHHHAIPDDHRVKYHQKIPTIDPPTTTRAPVSGFRRYDNSFPSRDAELSDGFDAEDYYISQLRAKQQKKANKAKSKSSRRTGSASSNKKSQTTLQPAESKAHHVHTFIASDDEMERDHYYYQRYAASDNPWAGITKSQVPKPYFRDDNNVLKRGGYHSFSDDN